MYSRIFFIHAARIGYSSLKTCVDVANICMCNCVFNFAYLFKITSTLNLKMEVGISKK